MHDVDPAYFSHIFRDTPADIYQERWIIREDRFDGRDVSPALIFGILSVGVHKNWFMQQT